MGPAGIAARGCGAAEPEGVVRTVTRVGNRGVAGVEAEDENDRYLVQSTSPECHQPGGWGGIGCLTEKSLKHQRANVQKELTL